MPGYFLNDIDAAAALIEGMGLPNLALQFDLYHCQIIHGDVTTRMRRLMPVIGHVQVASVPSRHEPDREELAYPFLLAELDRLGYAGFVGCEYRPKAGTLAGLGWFAPYRGTPAVETPGKGAVLGSAHGGTEFGGCARDGAAWDDTLGGSKAGLYPDSVGASRPWTSLAEALDSKGEPLAEFKAKPKPCLIA
jgi:hypothetical protein